MHFLAGFATPLWVCVQRLSATSFLLHALLSVRRFSTGESLVRPGTRDARRMTCQFSCVYFLSAPQNLKGQPFAEKGSARLSGQGPLKSRRLRFGDVPLGQNFPLVFSSWFHVSCPKPGDPFWGHPFLNHPWEGDVFLCGQVLGALGKALPKKRTWQSLRQDAHADSLLVLGISRPLSQSGKRRLDGTLPTIRCSRSRE